MLFRSQTHREAFAQAFAKDTDLPVDVSRRMADRFSVTVQPHVTDEAIKAHQNVANLYFELGIVPLRLDITKAYDRSFVISDRK